MRHVAIYARVSSDTQTRQATIDSQLAELKRRVADAGAVVLPEHLFVDDGYSGTTLLRPALERLRDAVDDGTIGSIYVHSPDRLARNYVRQMILLEELRVKDVTVVFANGALGQTPEEQLLVQVQGVIAEYERTKILERTRRGRIYRARQGSVSALAGAPYGYQYVRKSYLEPASYQVSLAEARIVRAIFKALVDEHKSMKAIARALNEQGHPTRGGRPWTRSTVWRIVRNPAYMGHAAFGKRESIERRAPLRLVRGRPAVPRVPRSYRTRPTSEWITIAVPPIVSKDIFDAAAEQLARNRQMAPRNTREQRYLLQGLLVCARCGYGWCGFGSSSKGRSYWYYRCGGTSGEAVGGQVCHTRLIRCDLLEEHVWSSIRALLEDPERLLTEWRRRAVSEPSRDQLGFRLDDARRRVAGHEQTLKRIIDAYEASAIELVELKKRSKNIHALIDRARADADALARTLATDGELRGVVARLEEFAGRVRVGLDRLSWSERQHLIRVLVAKIELDDDGATITYRVDPPAGDAGRSGGAGGGGGAGDPRTGNEAAGLRLRPCLRARLTRSARREALPTEHASMSLSTKRRDPTGGRLALEPTGPVGRGTPRYGSPYFSRFNTDFTVLSLFQSLQSATTVASPGWGSRRAVAWARVTSRTSFDFSSASSGAFFTFVFVTVQLASADFE